MKLSKLKRGQYYKDNNGNYFLGTGDGKAFQVQYWGKCERIDLPKEGDRGDKLLQPSSQEEFNKVAYNLYHDKDWWSHLCANAARRFTLNCAY